MNFNSIIKSLLALFIFSLFSVPPSAHAALGGNVSSIALDQNALARSTPGVAHSQARSKITVVSEKNITIHSFLVGGWTIREYVSSEGNIFAVSWQGSTQPDLSIILGAYFGEYQSALEQSKKNQGAAHLRKRAPFNTVKSENLVVNSSSRMRIARGTAYLSSMLPSGIAPSDIQ